MPQEDNSTTVSIRLSVPSFRKPKIPQTMRDYPGFWWLIIIGLLLVFTIGYQLGRASGRKAPVVSQAPIIRSIEAA